MPVVLDPWSIRSTLDSFPCSWILFLWTLRACSSISCSCYLEFLRPFVACSPSCHLSWSLEFLGPGPEPFKSFQPSFPGPLAFSPPLPFSSISILSLPEVPVLSPSSSFLGPWTCGPVPFFPKFCPAPRT
ncbi:MAG: hypothetical protein CM15mP65_07770 [Crocinitomicaceae bacterium]|nr:MAG: hypothetical protein CM15mP65_07770 [Crocinitomicaceae bacterium]